MSSSIQSLSVSLITHTVSYSDAVSIACLSATCKSMNATCSKPIVWKNAQFTEDRETPLRTAAAVFRHIPTLQPREDRRFAFGEITANERLVPANRYSQEYHTWSKQANNLRDAAFKAIKKSFKIEHNSDRIELSGGIEIRRGVGGGRIDIVVDTYYQLPSDLSVIAQKFEASADRFKAKKDAIEAAKAAAADKPAIGSVD
jgi:hypothetical protein